MRAGDQDPASSNVEKTRELMVRLLAETRRDTRSALSGIDPELMVHDDQPAWRVRDVVGHLGVWNGEAARSLQAHTGGAEYRCIPAPQYDEYNRAAARERSTWPMERVWAEYEASSDQLRTVVEALPAEKWNAEMLYPWSERGTVRRLVEIMMRHEAEHREVVGRAPGVTHAP